MNAEKAMYLAQSLNLIAFMAIAVWFVVPWLRKISRVDALMALASVHLGRTLCLQIYSSQDAGMKIADASRDHVVVGDLAGWALALIILFCLRYRPSFAIPLIWVLVAETLLDIGSATVDGIRDNAMGSLNGTTWLIVGVYVPLMLVALALTVWQLLARRSEQL